MDNRLEQAQLALIESNVREIERRIHLSNHEEALRGMGLYGLPYQIYYDVIVEGKLRLTMIYPELKYPEEMYLNVCLHDYDKTLVTNYCRSHNHDTYSFDIFSPENLKADLRNEVIRRVTKVRGWNLYDNAWKKYFLYFLQGYDFNTFSYFDFYGIPDDQDPQLLIEQYNQLQSEYDPDKHCEPISQNSCFSSPVIVNWNDADILEYNLFAQDNNLPPKLTSTESEKIRELMTMIS